MDRGAWLATVHGVTELDATEATQHAAHVYLYVYICELIATVKMQNTCITPVCPLLPQPVFIPIPTTGSRQPLISFLSLQIIWNFKVSVVCSSCANIKLTLCHVTWLNSISSDIFLIDSLRFSQVYHHVICNRQFSFLLSNLHAFYFFYLAVT